MQVDYLSLTNFRNYARLELNLPPSPVVLHGANAQGKTSLLEALYYLATARSPYTPSDRQLIHWRTEQDPLPFARLAADINSKHAAYTRIEMTLMMEPTNDGSVRFRKVIKLNGVDKRVMDLVGLLVVVLFLPQDLSLIEGGPSERRRYMNDVLTQVNRDYLGALEKYEQVLPQRNALLRLLAERGSNATQVAAQVEFWDSQLVEAGSILIEGRQRFLRELEVLAQGVHHDLTRKRETLTLHYEPNFAPTVRGNGQLSFAVLGLDLNRELNAEQIAPQFADRLKQERDESLRRGMTLCGPHRDDLRLHINGRDVSLYGSRGQARTAVLALKLAELAWLRTHLGEYPLLLLDEVVAELDAHRRAYLLERLDGSAQTLVTTTELDIFTAEFLQRSQVWQVEEGQIAASG